jgi:hypothetical protein|tara:strand:+ start:167 stop:661 length:495 start_codon:yes stop_codon:yes gene_type:complete
MKKVALLFAMSLMTTPAMAGGLVHKMSSSIQLNVNAATTTASRIGSSYSISGNGVNTTDGTTAGTVSTGTITSGVLAPGAISATQASNGNSFSYSQSYTQADAVPQSAATTGTIPNFSSLTSTSAGTAGDLAGTLTTAGAISLTAGGAGTGAIGQFVSEITVID